MFYMSPRDFYKSSYFPTLSMASLLLGNSPQLREISGNSALAAFLIANVSSNDCVCQKDKELGSWRGGVLWLMFSNTLELLPKTDEILGVHTELSLCSQPGLPSLS